MAAISGRALTSAGMVFSGCAGSNSRMASSRSRPRPRRRADGSRWCRCRRTDPSRLAGLRPPAKVVPGHARPGPPHGAGALAVVHAAAHGGQLFVGIAQHGIEGAGIDFAGRRQAACGGAGRVRLPASAAEDRRRRTSAARLPRLYVLQLLREARRVGRRFEGLLAQDGRDLVLAVAIGAACR